MNQIRVVMPDGFTHYLNEGFGPAFGAVLQLAYALGEAQRRIAELEARNEHLRRALPKGGAACIATELIAARSSELDDTRARLAKHRDAMVAHMHRADAAEARIESVKAALRTFRGCFPGELAALIRAALEESPSTSNTTSRWCGVSPVRPEDTTQTATGATDA